MTKLKSLIGIVACLGIISCGPPSLSSNGYWTNKAITNWALERDMYPSQIECYNLNETCAIFISANLPAVATCQNKIVEKTIETTCTLTVEGENFIGTDNVE